MAVLRNGSKCSHTTCMLRFFTVSRLALNANHIFEIGSRYHILTAFPNWKFYIAYEIFKVLARFIEKLTSIKRNG